MIEQTTISNEEVIELALEHFDCDMSELYHADLLSESITNLNALKGSIEAYKLDTSLIAFADHDNALSRYVHGFPYLELFINNTNLDWVDRDKEINYRSERSVEGIIHQIGQLSSRWYTFIKSFIGKYKKYILAAITIIGASVVAIAGYKKYTEGKTLHDQAWKEKAKPYEDKLHKLTEAIQKLSEEIDKKKQELKNVQSHESATDKFNLDIVATTAASIIESCLNNSRHIDNEAKTILTKIDTLETMLKRIDGGDNDATRQRRDEITYTLKKERIRAALLLNAARTNQHLAHTTSQCYA